MCCRSLPATVPRGAVEIMEHTSKVINVIADTEVTLGDSDSSASLGVIRVYGSSERGAVWRMDDVRPGDPGQKRSVKPVKCDW